LQMNGLRRLPLTAELVSPTLLLAVASGLAFVAIVAADSGLQTPVKASFLTLLYYMLPAGVGIAVLPSGAMMSRVGLRKAEHALLGYFVGLMIVALVVVVRERNSSPEMRVEWFDPAVLDYLMLGLGALGWLRMLQGWRDFRRAESFTRIALWCSPLFIVPYTVSFLVFSRYPLTDLFQFTHIMKGAEEFAGFDRLNPFTADSYAPVIQPLLGILLRLSGANSLDAVWLMPLPAYLLRVAVLYAVGKRLLSAQRGVTVFVAISLPFFGTGVLTNGDLAALGCLLVMALVLATLQQRNPSGGMTWTISAGVTAALVATLASSRLLADWLMLCLVFLVVLAIPLTARRPGALATFVTACLAIAVVAPLHRSTVLLVPAIAFSLAWITKPPLSRHAMAWTSAVLTIVGTAVVASVLLNEYGSLSIADPGKAITVLIDGVFGVRFSTSHDAMLGSGAKVALFEMARSVGPLIALWSLMLAPRCLSNKHDIRPVGHFGIRSDATWLTACALIVLLLLGLPFAYRAVFIPMVLFAVLIAQDYTRLDDRALTHVTAGLVALSLIIAVAEYAVPENSSAANYYINRAMPALLLCLLLIVAIGIASISRPTWLKFSAVMVLVWAVLFEKQVIRYHFFHYSFPGEPPPRAEPLSHYTLQDIKLAELIRHQYGDGILISDPYTLAITRALTGLNSIVTFSNLDTMNAQAAEELRQYLQSILLPGQESSEEHNCGEWQRAARLLGFGISSESNYALFQAANPGASGQDVLRAFGYRSGLLLSSRGDSRDVPIAENRHAWLMSSDLPLTPTSGAVSVRRSEREARVITVINGRTIEWAFGLFANQRHDGSETWESGSSMREVLIAKCNGALGPGHSVILAHPLGSK
jgi:hypothetical protein